MKVFNKYIFLLLSFLNYSLLCANDDLNNTTESSYVDDFHAILSDQFHDLSESLDSTLSSNFKGTENFSDFNTSKTESNTSKIKNLTNKSASVDAFFQTRKFIDETDATFVRITLDTFFQSRGNTAFKLKARAHIPLSRTKKNYNLFVEDVTEDNLKNGLLTTKEESTPSVGLNFFAPKTYGLESKYSIGTSGINPFVRARYNFNFQTTSWIIEPVQQFKYSVDKKFEEETNIYFDSLLSNLELFRIVLHRGTKEKEEGINYGASIQYYRILGTKTAISVEQSFFANTRYQNHTYNKELPLDDENFSGVYNYYTSFNWRQNIWKKWFFYELTPGVSFHRQHDYKPNYSILFSIDMYFGKLYKKN